ncbi:hypothetical protein T190_17770 [Sinorhizobium meliloti CCBAU 01290]|nr:hypothetical protein T190_17770 [Sinorhizobium meliloti CCBAU 01290]
MPISKSLSDRLLSQTGKYGMAKPLTISGAEKRSAMRSAKWRGGGPRRMREQMTESWKDLMAVGHH